MSKKLFTQYKPNDQLMHNLKRTLFPLEATLNPLQRESIYVCSMCNSSFSEREGSTRKSTGGQLGSGDVARTQRSSILTRPFDLRQNLNSIMLGNSQATSSLKSNVETQFQQPVMETLQQRLCPDCVMRPQKQSTSLMESYEINNSLEYEQSVQFQNKRNVNDTILEQFDEDEDLYHRVRENLSSGSEQSILPVKSLVNEQSYKKQRVQTSQDSKEVPVLFCYDGQRKPQQSQRQQSQSRDSAQDSVIERQQSSINSGQSYEYSSQLSLNSSLNRLQRIRSHPFELQDHKNDNIDFAQFAKNVSVLNKGFMFKKFGRQTLYFPSRRFLQLTPDLKFLVCSDEDNIIRRLIPLCEVSSISMGRNTENLRRFSNVQEQCAFSLMLIERTFDLEGESNAIVCEFVRMLDGVLRVCKWGVYSGVRVQ